MHIAEEVQSEMKQLKSEVRDHSFFIQIGVTMMAAIIVIACLVSVFVIRASEDVYMSAYTDSNTKSITLISESYYSLNEDVVDILTVAQNSNMLKDYLTNKEITNKEMMSILFNLRSQLSSNNMLAHSIPSNLLLVGLNGRQIFPNSVGDVQSAQEILGSDMIQDARNHPDEIRYYYAKQGFLQSSTGEHAIIAVKVLRDYTTKKEYGFAIVNMSGDDFAYFYNELIDSKINEIYIFDGTGQIISTNQRESIGKTDEAFYNSILESDNDANYKHQGNDYHLIKHHIPILDFTIVSLVDESALISQMNVYPTVIAFVLLVSILLIVTVLLLLRRYFQPLNAIIKQIPSVTKGNFDNRIEVKGSGEMEELANAYNYMLDGLNEYVDNVVKLESQKNMSEFHALQMQINPHFVYNTLTSIKFLVWQNDETKAIKAIDAFISLLRNTLGSKLDSCRLTDEIENIKNYAMIQNIRYNDRVQVNYHIPKECEDLIVLKMILQPFIENAFIHAFAENDKGTINVFARIVKDFLVIEIMDNGKGIKVDQVEQLFSDDAKKTQKLSGLGVKNVNNRIKLMYGDDYGVSVSGVEHKGTIVTIKLPILQEYKIKGME